MCRRIPVETQMVEFLSNTTTVDFNAIPSIDKLISVRQKILKGKQESSYNYNVIIGIIKMFSIKFVAFYKSNIRS